MDNGLNIGLSGLQAQQLRQDVTANNLANVNTPGYAPAAATQAERAGGGVDISAVGRSFGQAALQTTGQPLDVAVQGDGFFVLRGAEGVTFTRQGSFKVDGEGFLVAADGSRVQGLQGDIRVGQGVANIVADGTVSVTEGNTTRQAGVIAVARFANPQGLEAAGDTRFRATANSGNAQAGRAGLQGRGTLTAGFIEMSGVDLAKEMTDLIVNEKAFAVNIATIRTKDEMLGETLDLKK